MHNRTFKRFNDGFQIVDCAFGHLHGFAHGVAEGVNGAEEVLHDNTSHVKTVISLALGSIF